MRRPVHFGPGRRRRSTTARRCAPVTLAVVRGALEQIADEMDLHLIRAALSPIISETNDCAHGLYDAVSGETIPQGSYGLPQFLANMP